MAFFKCPKCKEFWQYPIEKCPKCFSNLERVKTQKPKIKAICKVTIPSLFHLKVPYFILLFEDKEGKRWIQKSEKEFEIGKEIEPEIKKEKGAVAIWRVKYDFLEAIETCIGLLGGLEIGEKSKILILPTLIKASHSYLRDNTSPEFLEAAFKFLFSLGVKSENIKVCAQSFDEESVEEKAIKSGLFEICQKYKVLTIDLSKGRFLKKIDLEISEELTEDALILNLPILRIGKPQATENIFFFLKKENFLAQKYLYSEEEILEKMKKILPPILTVAEAYHIQGERGMSYYFQLVLASFSFENLDRVFYEILGEKKLPGFLEKKSLEEIEIVGRKIEEVKTFFI